MVIDLAPSMEFMTNFFEKLEVDLTMLTWVTSYLTLSLEYMTYQTPSIGFEIYQINDNVHSFLPSFLSPATEFVANLASLVLVTNYLAPSTGLMSLSRMPGPLVVSTTYTPRLQRKKASIKYG